MSHEAIDPSFRALVDEHAPVRVVGSGFQFTEGPIWHPTENYLLFSDMLSDARRRWDKAGVRDHARPSNKSNGLTYDADLNLVMCEHATSSLARLTPDGRREVVASHFEGFELNSPNDVIVAADGSIYFSDPTYGRMPGYGIERPTQLGFQGVYRVPPGGGPPQLVVERYLFTQPNGLCFSPDEKLLYVNDTEQCNIRVFEVENGRLRSMRLFASGIRDTRKPGVPDGMKCDAQGNVWVTAPGGLWVYNPDGRLIGKVSIPEMAANLHWGGEDWRTLFVCASTSVYAVDVKVGPRNEPFMRARNRTTAPAAPAATTTPFDRCPPLDPRRTALIIQDMQNDVIIEGGAFAASGSPEHARAQNVVANSRRLAEACRRRGVLVIHVWFVCEPGYPAMLANAPLFQGLVAAKAMQRGTWGVAPVAGLEPQPGDVVVEKMTMSAWESGRLQTYLAGGGRDTLINTGAWTNMSVEHTARTGADKGYRIVVPQDACSTMNAAWHDASVNYAMRNVATVTTVDDVVAALG